MEKQRLVYRSKAQISKSNCAFLLPHTAVSHGHQQKMTRTGLRNLNCGSTEDFSGYSERIKEPTTGCWRRLAPHSIRKRKLSYFSHIMRREQSFEKQIFQGTMEGCSGRGRPVTAWADNIFPHFYCPVTWGWWVERGYRDNHQPPSSFSAIQSRYTCIMTVNNIFFLKPTTPEGCDWSNKMQQMPGPKQSFGRKTGEAKSEPGQARTIRKQTSQNSQKWWAPVCIIKWENTVMKALKCKCII